MSRAPRGSSSKISSTCPRDICSSRTFACAQLSGHLMPRKSRQLVSRRAAITLTCKTGRAARPAPPPALPAPRRLGLGFRPSLLEGNDVMEGDSSLREKPLSVHPPIAIFIIAGGRHALAVAREASFDSAGAFRLVAFDLDYVVLDEWDRQFRLIN